MEKKRQASVFIIATFIIALISLGVAFAAFSSTLRINGTAEVVGSNWNIYFTDGEEGTDPGTSEGREISANTYGTHATGSAIMTTADLTWNATFRAPGDKVSFDLYVRNDGDYNAKVTAISADAGSKTCTIGGSTETVVCSHIHYGVYNDAAGTDPVAVNDPINAGTSAHYYVIAYLDNVGWAADGSDLPESTVIVNPVQIQITFGQDGAAVSH